MLHIGIYGVTRDLTKPEALFIDDTIVDSLAKIPILEVARGTVSCVVHHDSLVAHDGKEIRVIINGLNEDDPRKQVDKYEVLTEIIYEILEKLMPKAKIRFDPL